MDGNSARVGELLDRLARRAGTAEQADPLLRAVEAALPEAPDGEMALVNLERWAAHLPTPLTTLSLLREDPRLLEDLLALFGASQYFSDILVRDPWLYSLFLEPGDTRPEGWYPSAVEGALRALKRPEGRRDALRRLKRREFLRTGWRDLARRAPLPEIVREISDLAAALVEGALRLAREELGARFPTASAAVQFAVIGMGKLGARELNYSSDVDLVFVMDSPTPQDEGHRRYATRLAETLIEILAADTGEGRCFRVDMRLRPEGRTGALVRSFGAFRDYYDRWAETWERQALIKARPVAGDEELGGRFMRLTRSVVYRRLQGGTVLEDVREMRLGVEQKLEAAGEIEGHVKEGRGTIRDVEFTVQLLQLLFGADFPALQVPDTLTALERLREVDLLSEEEHRIFREGYVFFREVEHRLQVLHDLAVRRVPRDPAALRRLGRSMGFPDGGGLLDAYRAHAEPVRELALALQRRLGVQAAERADPLRAALLAARPGEPDPLLQAELETRGFPEADAAAAALLRLAAGDPHYPHPSGTRRLFADLAPLLLDGCAAAADPTAALDGVARFADRKLLHRALYQTLLEHADSARALCRFAGTAPAAMEDVIRYPELSDLVTDAEQVSIRRSLAEMEADLTTRLAGAPTHARALSALRRFRHRELVRLGARHVLSPVPMEVETGEWSDVAEALVRGALETALARLRAEGRWEREDTGDLAVLALGRFGGRDLHFPSDLDLMYVFGGTAGLPQQAYEQLAQAMGQALQEMTPEGRLFEVDLRLRPEGRQGFTAASLDAVRRYYGEGGRAQTWELQALTRVRPVAGSAETAGEFREIVAPRVYRDPMPAEWQEEIRAMKRRIEMERVSDAARERDLKLGPGGLSDVEFLVQLLQLRHGAAEARLRQPSTTGMIRACAEAGILEGDEAERLLAAYELMTRLRQSLYLLRADGPTDTLPWPDEEPRMARALARAMGYAEPAELQAVYREVRLPVRELFLERVGGEP